jgi:NADH-quinone oxidoreductase subunit C
VKLLLPEPFEGHPLRKDFPLMSREAKPWPGAVEGEEEEEEE